MHTSRKKRAIVAQLKYHWQEVANILTAQAPKEVAVIDRAQWVIDSVDFDYIVSASQCIQGPAGITNYFEDFDNYNLVRNSFDRILILAMNY